MGPWAFKQFVSMDAPDSLRRMQGRNTLWQPGTDHGRHARQMVRRAAHWGAQGVSRHGSGRDKVHRQGLGNGRKEFRRANITRQIRRLWQLSVDWSRERFNHG